MGHTTPILFCFVFKMLFSVSSPCLCALQGAPPSLSSCVSKYSWFESKPAAPEFKKSAVTSSSRLTLRWVSALVELRDMCCCLEKGGI